MGEEVAGWACEIRALGVLEPKRRAGVNIAVKAGNGRRDRAREERRMRA
jgi:hypothetical protein